MDAYTDEEVECCFEEFYEDVHTEFLKFGEIVNFKVCKNGSFHLRGNVYVHYKSMDSALLAYNSINGRYFAGKQIRCEFVNLTRWKVAICGEYMKSGFKTCSHGSACNFIHSFRNPGGDYEWADFDKPPPKYWVKKMAALFGYSDDHEKLMERETSSVLKNSNKTQKADSDWYHSRRSRSREVGEFDSSGSGRRKHENERKRSRTDEKICEQNTKLKDNHKRKSRTSGSDSDRKWFDMEGNIEKRHKHPRKRSVNRIEGDNRRSHEDSDVGSDAIPGDRKKKHGSEGKNSRRRSRNDDEAGQGDWSDKERDRKRHHKRRSSRHRSRDYGYVTSDTESDRSLFDRDGDMETQHYGSRKSSKHRRSGFLDGYEDFGKKDEVDKEQSMEEKDRRARHHAKRKRSKHRKNLEYTDDHGDENVNQDCRGEWSDTDGSGDRHQSKQRK